MRTLTGPVHQRQNLLAQQGGSAAQRGQNLMTEDEIDGDGAEGPTTALVEIERGLAVVYGDHVPDGLDVIPIDVLGSEALGSLESILGTATGLANVAAQGVNGVIRAQGLVRLAPQTLQAMQAGAQPVTSGGWNIGTLASSGKFSTSVRWLPATGASAASVAAAMGPAVALLAIQFQLNAITDLSKHNIELTGNVLEAVRNEQWSAVSGSYKVLRREIASARDLGAVTDSIWTNVRGQEGALEAHWDLFDGNVKRHVTELRKRDGHKARRQYLSDHGEAILADCHGLMLAQSSWFTYQALRAGHLQRTALSNLEDAAHLKRIIADATERHGQALAETDALLELVECEFGIIAELDGKRTFKIGPEARAARDVATMAKNLHAAMVAIRGMSPRADLRAPAVPSISVFEDEVPDILPRVLRFRLERDEQVMALADVILDVWSLSGDAWAVVTDRRLLIARQKDFRRFGVIDEECPLDDIRYVRSRNGASGVRAALSGSGPIVDVITKDKNLTLSFDSWAEAGDKRETATMFANLLASFMQIPEDEVPKVPRSGIPVPVH